MMRQNLGKRDRLLWITIGIILMIISVYEISNTIWQLVVAIIGILFFISGLAGWSLIYNLLGYSSKGYGIDRITKRDIDKAVKEYGLESKPIIQIKPINAKKKKTAKKTVKKATKKTVKKTPSKKSTKKTTKKITKKTTRR